MATETLEARIKADTSDFSRKLNQMSKDFDKVTKNFDGLNRLGDTMKSVGKKLTVGLTVPIAGVALAGAKMSMDFGKSFAKVSTLLDSSTTDFNSYKKEVISASNDMGIGVNEFNEALYQSMSAGVKAGDSIKFTSDMVKLAKGGFTDTSTAVDLTTTILNSYGKEAGNTAEIMDKLIQTQNLGKTTVAELGSDMGKLIPIAKGTGVSFDDMLASMATLTAGGISTAESTTYLKSMVNELGKSGTKVSDILKNETGMSFQELNEKGTPLGETLGILKDYADKNGLAFNDLFGSSEAATAALALMGDEGVVLSQKLEGIKNSAGSADEAFKKVEDTAGAKLSKALNELKNSLIGIGDALSPFIEKIAEVISKVAEWIGKFKELEPQTQTFILIVAGILAAIGPLISIGGVLVKAFALIQAASVVLGVSMGSLMLPILGIVAVIAAVIAAGIWLCQNWDTVKAFASDCWNSVSTYVSEAWDNITQWISDACNNVSQWISDTWNSVLEWTSSVWNSITDWISNAWDTICNVVQFGILLISEILNAAFQIITLPFQFIWQNCSDFLINIWNSIVSFLSGIWENISSTCSTVFTTIKDFLEAIWTAMSIKCRMVWAKIASFLSEIWSNISSVCSTVFTTVRDFLQAIWTAVSIKCRMVWNNIRVALSSVWNTIMSTANSVFNNLKSTISNIWNSIKSTTSTVWEGIKTAISKPINAAKDAVSKAIDKMKSFLSVTLPFPKIKLPHFYFTGKFSLMPPSVPKFNVEWKSKGAIFKRPTVLGGIGVGDAHNGIGSNAEAVLPINKLPQLLGLDKQNNSGNLSLNIENFNNNREQDVKELVEEIAFYLKRKNIAIGG